MPLLSGDGRLVEERHRKQWEPMHVLWRQVRTQHLERRNSNDRWRCPHPICQSKQVTLENKAHLLNHAQSEHNIRLQKTAWYCMLGHATSDGMPQPIACQMLPHAIHGRRRVVRSRFACHSGGKLGATLGANRKANRQRIPGSLCLFPFRKCLCIHFTSCTNRDVSEGEEFNLR